MKQKSIKIIVIVISVICAIGTGILMIQVLSKYSKSEDNTSTVVETKKEIEKSTEQASQVIVTESDKETIQTEKETEQQNKVTNVEIKQQYEDVVEEGQVITGEYGIITGYSKDGTKIWSIRTQTTPAAELDSVREIGIHNNRYYYETDGILYALKLVDGTTIWKSKVSVAIIAKDFGENDTLYCCGYHGADLLVVDKDGKIQKTIKEFSKEYSSPYDIKYRGDHLEIKVESNEGMVRVELPSYKYSFN